MRELEELFLALEQTETESMAGRDFLLSWDKTDDEIRSVLTAAELLRHMRSSNISARMFDSGLAVSVFRDNSTRTRFSFASACNLLGLSVQDLDEGKSQAAHGETLRETSTMISFMADVIGVRDDMYIGKGHASMKEMAEAVELAYREGVLEQRPTLVNLQCDLDHPTQSLADLMHLTTTYGEEWLRGKKIAMSWAYSPSYGKPLSVPQGIITLMTRFGMDVCLACPEGYDLMPGTEETARKHAGKSGGTFTKTHDMREAFKDADIVYPKSWAPFNAMEKRTQLYDQADFDGIKALEKELLAENAKHMDWECTEELMKTTKNGSALYMHCLPADITGVSCERGEVDATVFDRSRADLYREAGWKPYVIAAMILLSKVKRPSETLGMLMKAGKKRFNG